MTHNDQNLGNTGPNDVQGPCTCSIIMNTGKKKKKDMSPETRQNSETNKPSVIKIASPVLKDLAFHRACSYELNNKDQLVGTNSNQVCSWQHLTESCQY